MRKKQRADASARSDTQHTCEHEWQTFRESLVPERTGRQLSKSDGFKGRGAHFVVRGCPKCRLKRRVQLVVTF